MMARLKRIHQIDGFQVAGLHCGIKTSKQNDLGLIVADTAVSTAAIFTNNRICAAPVKHSRSALKRNKGMARAILANTISVLETGRESLLRECCEGNFYKLTPEDIYNTALDGDNLAREMLKHAGKYLGIGISNMINIMSPDAVILAGGLIGAWDIYIQEAIREASRRAFRELFDQVKIIPSVLRDNAGIIGSALLVFQGRSQPRQ